MKFGVSGLTHKIYCGNTRVDPKTGLEEWTEKTDVTDEVQRCVFERFYHLSQKQGEAVSLTVKGFGTLRFEPYTEEKSEE